MLIFVISDSCFFLRVILCVVVCLFVSEVSSEVLFVVLFFFYRATPELYVFFINDSLLILPRLG